MRFKALVLAITAVFTLVLLSALAVPPSGLAVAAQQAGSNSGPGSDDDGNGSPIEGRRIFVRENCVYCHGGFAGGAMCPSLREDRPDESDVRDVIEEGTENGMPPYPHLDNERDIRNLAAYFQSLRTRREPTFTHWWEPIPTQ